MLVFVYHVAFLTPCLQKIKRIPHLNFANIFIIMRLWLRVIKK